MSSCNAWTSRVPVLVFWAPTARFLAFALDVASRDPPGRRAAGGGSWSSPGSSPRSLAAELLGDRPDGGRGRRLGEVGLCPFHLAPGAGRSGGSAPGFGERSWTGGRCAGSTDFRRPRAAEPGWRPRDRCRSPLRYPRAKATSLPAASEAVSTSFSRAASSASRRRSVERIWISSLSSMDWFSRANCCLRTRTCRIAWSPATRRASCTLLALAGEGLQLLLVDGLELVDSVRSASAARP